MFNLNRSQGLLLTALIIDYSTAFTMAIAWKNDSACYLIVAVSSLFIGIVLGEIEKVLVFIMGSYVVSAAIAILAFISPSLIYGDPYVVIDVGILGSAGDIILVSFIALPLCLFIGFLGSFLAGNYLD
jgi:hypothetical protein